MISRIRGKVEEIKDDRLLIDVGGLSYEILIPAAIMDSIKANISDEDFLELVTYCYYKVEPSRSVSVMIGFADEIEREFFIKFISVSGIGPKAAVKALSLPISTIAEAIDSANHTLLQSLPGVGRQRAREIIAKLQGKVGKYGLMRDKEKISRAGTVDGDIQKEAVQVLVQLQYKKQEAEKMLYQAFVSNPNLKTVEEILNEIYRQRSKKGKNE
ncbi:MAG: hypothetical protein KAU12_00800 [Candidatus Omnitrophica bacterium]|nr:hypothetical protein [Candidatus Omnitrophota bacterium]